MASPRHCGLELNSTRKLCHVEWAEAIGQTQFCSHLLWPGAPTGAWKALLGCHSHEGADSALYTRVWDGALAVVAAPSEGRLTNVPGPLNIVGWTLNGAHCRELDGMEDYVERVNCPRHSHEKRTVLNRAWVDQISLVLDQTGCIGRHLGSGAAGRAGLFVREAAGVGARPLL